MATVVSYSIKIGELKRMENAKRIDHPIWYNRPNWPTVCVLARIQNFLSLSSSCCYLTTKTSKQTRVIVWAGEIENNSNNGNLKIKRNS